MSVSVAQIPIGLLRVTGSDRVAFVHGQTSNNIQKLPEPGACRALLLNVRGQIEFDVRVYRLKDALLLQTAAGLELALLERLRRYVIFDDVQIERLTGWSLQHFLGEQKAWSEFGWVAEGARVQQTADAMLVAHGRGFGLALDVLSQQPLGVSAETISAQALERARVSSGLVDAHADGFVGLLPQECGLEGAVSYQKGCYIGQEIMARVEARGNTQRELRSVRFKQALMLGARLEQHGREVGRLGAPVVAETGFVALAVLRKGLEPVGLSADGVGIGLSAPLVAGPIDF